MRSYRVGAGRRIIVQAERLFCVATRTKDAYSPPIHHPWRKNATIRCLISLHTSPTKLPTYLLLPPSLLGTRTHRCRRSRPMLNQSINRPLVLRYMPRREVLYLTCTSTDRPTDRPATGSFFFLSFFSFRILAWAQNWRGMREG